MMGGACRLCIHVCYLENGCCSVKQQTSRQRTCTHARRHRSPCAEKCDVTHVAGRLTPCMSKDCTARASTSRHASATKHTPSNSNMTTESFCIFNHTCWWRRQHVPHVLSRAVVHTAVQADKKASLVLLQQPLSSTSLLHAAMLACVSM
jgi:hypothetical protein